jgi:hypothetical protein
MAKHSPEVLRVLDEIEAWAYLHRFKRPSVLRELARYLGKPSERVYEWINNRKHMPLTDTFLIMLRWIEEKKASFTPAEKGAFNDSLEAVQARRKIENLTKTKGTNE